MARKKPMIIYENTVQGTFVERINRFTARVMIEDKEEIVHVKNTGRLGELLIPKGRVTLQKAQDPSRKTAYDLISVYRPGMKWVNIDSLAPNKLMKQQLDSLGVYDFVKPEYTFGESRIDFYMEHGGQKFLTEVKGCTLAPEPRAGFGLFPDAPTVRGVRHLKELARAAGEGYSCSVAFVIQMNGIHLVFPNNETQPEFGRELVNAARAGVRIVNYSCHVEANSIKITGIADDTARYLKN